MAKIDTILGLMTSEHAGGLRLRVGRPPELLFQGEPRALTMADFDEAQLGECVRAVTTTDSLQQLYRSGEVVVLYPYRGRKLHCTLTTGPRGLVAEFRSLDDGEDVVDAFDGLGADESLELDDLSDPGGFAGGAPTPAPLAGELASLFDGDDEEDEDTNPDLPILEDPPATGHHPAQGTGTHRVPPITGAHRGVSGEQQRISTGTFRGVADGGGRRVTAPHGSRATGSRSDSGAYWNVSASSARLPALTNDGAAIGASNLDPDTPVATGHPVAPEQVSTVADPAQSGYWGVHTGKFGALNTSLTDLGADHDLGGNADPGDFWDAGGTAQAPATAEDLFGGDVNATDDSWAAEIHYTREEATRPPELKSDLGLGKDEWHRLLVWMVEQDATDLHITPNFPPTLRVDNVFQPSQGRSFTPDELEKLFHSLLRPALRAELDEHQSVDLSYELPGVGRFRMNIFRQFHGFSAAVRYIRESVDSLEALNLPQELHWISKQQVGLCLFTGPTGSGKSTTMAAILEQMNKNRQMHILTLEHPIEFLFHNRRSLVQQREVGTHTESFKRGLRDALRENPDVIMVGEMRDMETVSMAMTASETGHLILATLHSNTTSNALSRIIDMFPQAQQGMARSALADVLKAVVNIRLLRHASGRGLIPAVEFLKTNYAISNLIREDKIHNIRQVLTTAATEGMWTFERHLSELYRRQAVDYDTAYSAAPDKKVFESTLGSMGLKGKR